MIPKQLRILLLIMPEKIQQTADNIRSVVKTTPETGIILGSGLGGLVKEISIEHSINYSDILNFPVSTVVGHAGRLIFGKLSGKNVVVMQGRIYFFERYSMHEITFPVRVMKFLGIKKLFIFDAASGINPAFYIGELTDIAGSTNI